MCGIGGVILNGEVDDYWVEFIRDMSIFLQKRGEDAYGFIVVGQDGRVKRLFKLPITAEQAWEQLGDVFREWMLGARAVLVHTRAATSGSPKKNKNNHPFKINDWYLAHNGWAGITCRGSYSFWGYGIYYFGEGERVKVATKTKKENKDEPETDSYRYLFKPLVQKLSEGMSIEQAITKVWQEERVHGSFWLYNEGMGKLWLYRGEKELELIEDNNTIIFASEGLKQMGGIELVEGRLLEIDVHNLKIDWATVSDGNEKVDDKEIESNTKLPITKVGKKRLKKKLRKILEEYGYEWVDEISDAMELIYEGELDLAIDLLKELGYVVYKTYRGMYYVRKGAEWAILNEWEVCELALQIISKAL